MKLLARIAQDVRQGARWTQTVCLLVLVIVAITANVVMWTHNLSWTELGLLMVSTLTTMLALGRYITTSVDD